MLLQKLNTERYQDTAKSLKYLQLMNIGEGICVCSITVNCFVFLVSFTLFFLFFFFEGKSNMRYKESYKNLSILQVFD